MTLANFKSPVFKFGEIVLSMTVLNVLTGRYIVHTDMVNCTRNYVIKVSFLLAIYVQMKDMVLKILLNIF